MGGPKTVQTLGPTSGTWRRSVFMAVGSLENFGLLSHGW